MLRRSALALTVIFALAMPSVASAATAQSFQISPPTANYAADPGGVSRGIIKVTNLTDTPISPTVCKQHSAAPAAEGAVS